MDKVEFPTLEPREWLVSIKITDNTRAYSLNNLSNMLETLLHSGPLYGLEAEVVSVEDLKFL